MINDPQGRCYECGCEMRRNGTCSTCARQLAAEESQPD